VAVASVSSVVRCLGVLVLTSCAPEAAVTEPTTTTTSSSSDETSSIAESDGTTTTTSLPCDCVEGSACGNPTATVPGCDVPEPCPLVDESNEEALTCALELVRDRQMARFRYFHQGEVLEWWDGVFYVLGPDRDGIDFECHTIDMGEHERVRYHSMEPPEYFEDCLAIESYGGRRSCFFQGFDPVGPVPYCPG